MNEQNELSDIILSKGNSAGTNKKVILAVAVLAVVLIVVVMLMGTLSPDADQNIPQAIPQQQKSVVKEVAQPAKEALFEEVEVVQEDEDNNDNLDKIAQRLKKESREVEEVTVAEPIKKKAVKTQKKKVVKKATKKPQTKKMGRAYFVQVGSFSKLTPNKKFINSITNKGFEYILSKIPRGEKTQTKVLIGPFANKKEARTALRTIRSDIEAGAFLVKF